MLAWHVHYWDHLGWKDPFGDKEHAQRQALYARAAGSKDRFTPQFLADGAGVSAHRLLAAVEKGSDKRPVLAIEAQMARREEKGKTVTAAVRITRLGQDPIPDDAQVLAVLFQRSSETRCTAGENKGETLREHFIARKTAGPFPLAPFLTAEEGSPGIQFDLPADAAADDLGIIIIVEDPRAMTPIECRSFPVKGKE